jgi:hypothetical protein
MKMLLVVLILMGAAWAYPPSRERIAHAATPVLEKLGPVGERLLAPAKRYQARSELDFLVKQMKMDRDEARPLPDARTFPQWIQRKRPSGGDENDPWDTPYYLIPASDGLSVVSAGPDRQRGTEDDIRESLPLPPR